MAHLVWCWCGKRYRCDLEHWLYLGPCTIFHKHEHNCPDILVHGPIPLFGGFTTLETPKFDPKEKLTWSMDIKQIIESNPMKDPL